LPNDLTGESADSPGLGLADTPAARLAGMKSIVFSGLLKVDYPVGKAVFFSTLP
ncbi:hypothetical protein scyTo_0010058, partial [Scyliorhinus torazame]|nr:hypothetical protein [Scyliorhinus torazame]